MATTQAFQEGDRVRIVDRDANADDIKSQLFYNHFRGLTGTISKLYTTHEAAVDIEKDALTEAVFSRHHDVQEQMKSKWMDGLSEEMRGRLTEAERDFQLRYTVLVAVGDLTAPGKELPPKRAVIASPTAAISTANAAPTPTISTPDAEADTAFDAESSAPRRATSDDLSAAEQAEIDRRLKGE